VSKTENQTGKAPTLAQILAAARRLARAELRQAPCQELVNVVVKLETCETLLAEMTPAAMPPGAKAG